MFGKAKGKNALKARAWAAVAFVGTLVVNGLAGSTTLIGGTNTATVSNDVPTLFTPAGSTFAIWGVIYLLVAAYVVYSLHFARKKSAILKAETIDAITPLFTASSLINIAWIFAWQYKVFWLAVILIIALLVTLGQIVSLLRDKQFSLVERVVVKAPFSIYFGWLTVATVANISIALVNSGWTGTGSTAAGWTIAILIIAAVVGIFTMLRNTDCLYGLVFVWAFNGILTKHMSTADWNGQYPLIIGALVSLIAVLALVSLAVMAIVIHKLTRGEKRTSIDWSVVAKA